MSEPVPAPLPPQAVEMEAQVLGAMLIDRAAADAAVAALQPEDFYKSTHQTIFRAARALLVETQQLDQALLRQRLADEGRLEEVGGVLAISELSQGVATSAHAAQYMEHVKDRALARQIIAVSTRLARDGAEPGRRAEDLLAAARASLDELSTSTGRGLDAVAPRMSSCFSRLEALRQGPPEWLLRPKGFEPLTDLLPGAGLWPGLYVLGGPPMVGKTTFVMQLVEAVCAAHPAAGVLYVSGEMTEDDLVRSCVCRGAELDQTALLRGQLSAGEWGRFDAALVAACNRLHHVRCIRDLRVSRIRALARQLKPSLVVADFLQLLEPEGDFAMAKDRIDAVARELMLLRDEHPHLPVIVLASHNRGEAKKPYAPGRGYGAYKETGNIEYCADRCFNLEFTEADYQRSRDGTMGAIVQQNLVVLKNRLGSPGRVEMDFVGALQTFRLGTNVMYGAFQGQRTQEAANVQG